MRKFLSAAVAAAMAASVGLVCFSGCENAPQSFDECVDVWSVPNTEKVMQDYEYADDFKQEAALSFEMAKGEYENAQIIMTAKADVDSIDAKVSDLKSGENVISKDNMEILFQKYVNIDKMSNPLANFPTGMYPDAIVPLDAIQEAGEDEIEAGENQGLYFTLKTPAGDCAAGEYTGTLTLTVNGFESSFPISVTVWDFVIPQETHAQTMFNVFRDNLIGGELDNTKEMYEKYYEFLLDYRIAAGDLPQYDDTVEGYVEIAKKYAADPRCSAYAMKMYYVGYRQINIPDVINKNIYENDWQSVYDRLYALAEASTPELNLFDKLYIFDHSIDEPEGTNRVDEANYKNMKFIETFEQVVADLEAANFDFAAHGMTKDDILGLEVVVTNAYTTAMPDLRTYCPQMQVFNTEEGRATYERIREEDPYKTTWWYVCWTPQYPYANYRIEESIIGPRVIFWMQKNYDINGFLYWGTSGYNLVGVSSDKQIRDVYNDPWSYPGSSGDGCLTYPGRPYGIDGPVSSLRLEAIRAGLEDYEYLWYLEYLLNESGSKYDVDFDFDSIMSTIYSSLYEGVTPNYSGEKLQSARREVAEMIELLASDHNAVLNVSQADVSTNEVTLELYVDKDTSVKINGNEVSGTVANEGMRYEYKVTLTEQENYATIELTRGDVTDTFVKFIGKKVNGISLVSGDTILLGKSNGSSADPKEHITLSKNTDLDEMSAEAVKVSIARYETDNEAAALFYAPELYIEKSWGFADANFAEVDTLEFMVYNAGDTDKELVIYLTAGSQQQRFLEVTLTPGMNEVSLKQIYLSSWTNLANADGISLVFEQCEADTPDVYYIGNVYYTLR